MNADADRHNQIKSNVTYRGDFKRQNYRHLGDKSSDVKKHQNAKSILAKADKKSCQTKYQNNYRNR